MTSTTAELRAAQLYNGYNITWAGPEPRVVIEYSPTRDGYGHGRCWDVTYGLSPTAITHHVPVWGSGQSKKGRLAAAQAWASERFGIAAWERSPYGTWHPAGTIAAALAARQETGA